MANNSTNISKPNNNPSSQHIEHKKETTVYALEIKLLAWEMNQNMTKLDQLMVTQPLIFKLTRQNAIVCTFGSSRISHYYLRICDIKLLNVSTLTF
jgi:hypothetical protein